MAAPLLVVRHRTPFTKPIKPFFQMIEIVRYPILEVSGFAVYNAHFRCTHVGDMKGTCKATAVGKAWPENIPFIEHPEDHPGRVQAFGKGFCLYHGYQLRQHGCSGQSTAYDRKIEVPGSQFF